MDELPKLDSETKAIVGDAYNSGFAKGHIAGLKEALEIEVKHGHIGSATAAQLRDRIAELEKES